MKVLLFFSGKDSLSQSFNKGFLDNSWQVKIIDIVDYLSNLKNTLYERSILFPTTYRRIVENYYMAAVQKKYLEIASIEKPDLVLIYNDQFVEFRTIKEIKKTAKVAVYLADSPMFLQRREHFLPMLFEADHIFAPDTFWIEQLKTIGLKRVSFLIGGYHLDESNETQISSDEADRYSSDLFYIGSPYNDSYGYKRALFLSKFADMDIKIYGPDNWKYWFKYFPELERKMVLGARIPFPTLQKIMKCCKIYPIDANPGLINGLHMRIFDSIAAGLLPIVEYRKDIAVAFPDLDIPTIYNYNDIPDLVTESLADTGRQKHVERLRLFLKEKYEPKIVVSELIKLLY